MHITLSPQITNTALTVKKQGDTLIINGDHFDFSVIPDGATLPFDAIENGYFAGPVERVDGVLRLTLLLPISDDASEAARFPTPIVDPVDGILELPR